MTYAAIALVLGFGIASTTMGCAANAERAAQADEERRVDGGIDLPASSPRLAFVKVETVGTTAGASDVTLTGKVTYDENHTQRLASPVDGRATRVLAELGDDVKAGQPLVELSSPNVGQLHADVQKAQQDVSLGKKNLERAERLYADKAIAQRDVAQAESDFAKAKADLANASSHMGSLNLALAGGMTAGIRSQIDGTVVERSILVGQEVRSDQANPLITVSDLSTVWVSADVYEDMIGVVAPGTEVVVTVSAYPNEKFPGKIANVSHVVDPSTHSVKVRCVVPNPDKKLKPEMFARIALKDTSGQQLTISARGVLAESQPPHVVVVDGEHYILREVSVGPEVNGRVRILAGLKAGEKVVTDGAIFLKQEIQTQ